jgi:hypothetical protein
MNLSAAAIVLRPRPLSEVLDLASRLTFSVALGLYLRLAAAVLLPSFAACLALRYAAGWSWIGVWLAALALGGVTQGVFTVAVGRLMFSEALGARTALGLFRKRFGAYLGALVASRFILVAAASVFLLGLPFAWPRMLFVHEVSLLESARPLEAVSRASRFVTGRVGEAVATLLALAGTQLAIVFTAEMLGQGIVDQVLQLGRPFGALFADGGSPYALAGFFLSIPYVSTARFLQYIDARTRADGWDVQLRFLAVASADDERRAA